MLIVDSLLLILAALLPIANPLSTAPIFLTLSASMTPAEQRKLARDASIYMAIVLLTVLIAGIGIMELFGISLGGLQVAGGLVILRIGFPMLFPAPAQAGAQRPDAQIQNPAFVPLAMPMMSGPGAIAVVLTIASRIQEEKIFRYEVLDYLAAALGIVLVAIICWLVLRASTKLVKRIGHTAIDAVSRIMGFILICIGVEFCRHGIVRFLTETNLT
jgi:multiple antibiotic resistance protein